MFTIAVDKQQFNNLLAESVFEYQKSKDGTMKVKCKKLTGIWIISNFNQQFVVLAILGKWINVFKEAINKVDNEECSLLGKIARINETIKHQDGSWFSALGNFKSTFMDL